MSFDRRQSPGYMVNYMARLFAQALYRRIGPHGVTTGQFPVLLALWEREGVTQSQLAQDLAVEQPTMANTLKRMERDGLIERVPDPGDRRQARVHLTAQGQALRTFEISVHPQRVFGKHRFHAVRFKVGFIHDIHAEFVA